VLYRDFYLNVAVLGRFGTDQVEYFSGELKWSLIVS
jgi:hypothetical protein